MSPLQGFGGRTWNLDVMIAGARSQEQVESDLEHLVNFLGMDRAGMGPDVRTYPIPDGRGGWGLTAYQPFVEPFQLHQPLTTSFMIFDVWPEHFTVTIKSCLPFSAEAVMQEMRRRFGPEAILDNHFHTLGRVARWGRAFCGAGGG